MYRMYLPFESILSLNYQEDATKQAVRVLILTPTKELCAQARQNLTELSKFCMREIKIVDVSGQASLSSQKSVYTPTSSILQNQFE